MIALRFFLRSWYGNVLILMLLAATSSFLITFYTTALSVPWSITLEKHLMIFLFSFVLMFFAIFLISYVIYRLDANNYLRKHELLRYMIQFILLVLLMGAVALRVVYAVYLTFFRVDLQKSEYFERDYVVVLFCLIMVQVYFAIRKNRKLSAYALQRSKILYKWVSLRDEVINEMGANKVLLLQEMQDLLIQKDNLQRLHEVQLDELRAEQDKQILLYVTEQEELRMEKENQALLHENQLIELRAEQDKQIILYVTEREELYMEQENQALLHKNQLVELRDEQEKQTAFYVTELDDLRARKQRLRSNHELLTEDEMRLKICMQELTDEILVIIGAENEWVRIAQIAYFHLKEGSSRFKLVDVQLLDGREGKVDMESLAKIEKRWPNLLFRAGRGHLIMHLAVREIVKEGDVYSIELYGARKERLKVQHDVYNKLVKLGDEWARLIPESQ